MAVPLHDPGLGRKRQLAWIVALALSPVAYFGAAEIEKRLPHQPTTPSITREQAFAAGRAFAATRPVDINGWNSGISTSHDSQLELLLERTHPPAIDSVSVPTTIETHFGRSSNEWLIVTITPDGRVLGFRSAKPAKPGQPVDEAKARAVAEQYLRGRLGPASLLPFEQARMAAGSEKGGWLRQFTWQVPIPGLPQATANLAIEMAGDRIVSERRSLDLQPEFKKTLAAHKGRWRDVLKIGTILLFAILAIYAVVRYVQRSIEKEISHRRTVLVIGAFVVFGCGMMFGNDQFGVAATSGSTANVWFGLTLGFLFVGLFFGVAYGAGEGDLREMHPGKLCSLDALLSGKIFSANFARSLLGGAAVAGWLLLAQNAALLAVHGGPVGDGGRLSPDPSILYPLVDLASDTTISLVLAIGYGLMLPLTLLRRWNLRREWITYSLLVVVCAIAAHVAAADGNTWQNAVILDAALLAAICVPFFFGDLVASVTALSVLALAGELVRRSAQTAQWHTIAYNQVLPAAVGFLLIELYFAWRGRVYEEAEVRPLYARNLAHRQALAAEIGAARVAQLRLLPDAPPPIAGLTIAGSCTTAREVGGDFFDYYGLDTHRIALFVAEGGDRELGSAMAIALAKGFLLYTSRLDLPPIEVLRRLRATLGSVLHGDGSALSVLYAVVDGRDGSVRYARSGRSPRLLLNGKPLAEEIVTDRAEGFEIRHGAAILGEDETLLVFTDGLSRQLARRSHMRVEETVRELGRRSGEASEIHRAVLDAAFKRKRDVPPDDVTAVVICRPASAAQAIGGIA